MAGPRRALFGRSVNVNKVRYLRRSFRRLDDSVHRIRARQEQLRIQEQGSGVGGGGGGVGDQGESKGGAWTSAATPAAQARDRPTHYRYRPPPLSSHLPPEEVRCDEGVVKTFAYRSWCMAAPMAFRLFLPQGYHTPRRLPRQQRIPCLYYVGDPVHDPLSIGALLPSVLAAAAKYRVALICPEVVRFEQGYFADVHHLELLPERVELLRRYFGGPQLIDADMSCMDRTHRRDTSDSVSSDAVPTYLREYNWNTPPQWCHFFVNAAIAPHNKYMRIKDFVTMELPSLVNSCFPQLDGLRVGITGYLAGGGFALLSFLRYSGMYNSVSALCPITNPSRLEFARMYMSQYVEDKFLHRYDATERAKNYKGPLHEILIDQGENDEFLGDVLQPWAFQDACRNSGLRLTLRYQGGYGHEFDFLSAFLPQHVEFHAQFLHQTTEQHPYRIPTFRQPPDSDEQSDAP